MYTILGEKVRPYMSGSWFGMYTVMPRGDLHLDRATYSWPSEKTWPLRYSPTLFNVKPWALLMVIAKVTRIGSWFRLRHPDHCSR